MRETSHHGRRAWSELDLLLPMCMLAEAVDKSCSAVHPDTASCFLIGLGFGGSSPTKSHSAFADNNLPTHYSDFDRCVPSIVSSGWDWCGRLLLMISRSATYPLSGNRHQGPAYLCSNFIYKGDTIFGEWKRYNNSSRVHESICYTCTRVSFSLETVRAPLRYHQTIFLLSGQTVKKPDGRRQGEQ